MTQANTQENGAAAGAEHAPYKRKLIGLVASDKMDKTVVVEVVRYKMDRMYKKYVKVRKRYQAHDETNQYHVGDRVEITEHRPISKNKRWLVTNLIEKAQAE
jgi:small subunit ribosomal protein S17